MCSFYFSSERRLLNIINTSLGCTSIILMSFLIAGFIVEANPPHLNFVTKDLFLGARLSVSL